MAIWSLKYSLFFFAGLGFTIVYNAVQGFSWGVPFLPILYLCLALFGLTAFLLPFYSIHRTLIKVKKQKLGEVEEETDKLIQELTETSAKYPAGDSRDRILLITSRLVSLQIREKSVRESREWPIDITTLSLLTGIILVPISLEIIINLIFSP